MQRAALLMLAMSMLAGCSRALGVIADMKSACGAPGFVSVGVAPVQAGCAVDDVEQVAVCRDANGIYAMNGTCDNGCNLDATSTELDCPCHGGSYDLEGDALQPAGPPLTHYALCVDADRDAWVDVGEPMPPSTRTPSN